jgi:hypothetical protein
MRIVTEVTVETLKKWLRRLFTNSSSVLCILVLHFRAISAPCLPTAVCLKSLRIIDVNERLALHPPHLLIQRFPIDV